VVFHSLSCAFSQSTLHLLLVQVFVELTQKHIYQSKRGGSGTSSAPSSAPVAPIPPPPAPAGGAAPVDMWALYAYTAQGADGLHACGARYAALHMVGSAAANRRRRPRCRVGLFGITVDRVTQHCLHTHAFTRACRLRILQLRCLMLRGVWWTTGAEVALSEGDHVLLLETDAAGPGWSRVRNTASGKEGFCPHSYLGTAPPEASPATEVSAPADAGSASASAAPADDGKQVEAAPEGKKAQACTARHTLGHALQL